MTGSTASDAKGPEDIYGGRLEKPCPCNILSKAVCTYANTMRICYGRPELILQTDEEKAELADYFKTKGKKRKT